MIITHNGVIKDARILARSGDTMRIALAHSNDAVELNLVDGNWFSAERQQISWEFLLDSEIPLLLPEESAIRGRTRTAYCAATV